MELQVQDFLRKEVIVIISYNPDPKARGSMEVNGRIIIPLGCTFNHTGRNEDKRPVNVHGEDPHWKFLLACKKEGILLAALLFLGYIKSGSAAIIIQAEDFGEAKHLLYFLECPHDLEVKNDLLDRLGFLGGEHRREFTDEDVVADPTKRCREWDHLWNWAEEIARSKK